MTRLLGLDPGSRRLGWGAIEVDGSRIVHLGHGTIVAPERHPLPERLVLLHDELEKVLGRVEPVSIGLEQVYTGRNPKSALTLGQARGVVMLCVGRRGLELAEYAPAEIKVAVTGNGRSAKSQIARMLERLLAVDLADAGEDSTDALAVAVCHAHGRQRRRLVERARSTRA
jgi:crossover junction endodeoxyribonuclease RuvC